MQRSLIIAIGNPLRRDDGVAHHVPAPPGAVVRSVLQLTPEVAEEIAPFDLVVFLDASVTAAMPRLEPVAEGPGSSLTHMCSPGSILALSRSLFGFAGRAYVCHLPIADLSAGEGLSPLARRFAEQAAGEIEHIMGA